MKVCKHCSTEKSLDEFPTYVRNGKMFWFAHCRKCGAARSKAWKEANREKDLSHRAKRYDLHKDTIKLKRIEKTYGLSAEDYSALWSAQEGICAICKKAPATDVDHCHTTNKVRGLLCNNCNRALGHFKDSPEILQRAIQYLTEGLV